MKEPVLKTTTITNYFCKNNVVKQQTPKKTTPEPAPKKVTTKKVTNKKVTTTKNVKKDKKEEEKPPSKNRGYWLKLTEKKKEQERMKSEKKPLAPESEVPDQSYCTEIVTKETSTLVHSINQELPEHSINTHVGKIRIESEKQVKTNYSWESSQTGDLESKQND